MSDLGGAEKRFRRGRVPVPTTRKELALLLASDLVLRRCVCTSEKTESKMFDMFLEVRLREVLECVSNANDKRDT